MILAFVLYKYFPYGGLQSDFYRIATECKKRGHTIRVYTKSWQGDNPEAFDIHFVPTKGRSSQAQNRFFSDYVEDHISANPVNGVIGFNKMPGLDIYYAADSCFEHQAQTARNWLYRLSGRYKHFSSFERSVFGRDSKTHILMISNTQLPLFKKYYGTDDSRFHLLPPGIRRDRIAPPDADQIRKEFRQEFDIKDDDFLALMVGSGFKTKGVDRSLLALSALKDSDKNRVKLFVVGQDNPRQFIKMANELGLKEQVTFFAGRDDVPRFLLGADLLLHPAYNENTGTVIVEAIVAGLPVLVSSVCGYAHHVTRSNTGLVLDSTFDQKQMNDCFQNMLNSSQRQEWQRNGIKYAASEDLYSLPEKAVDIIERYVGKAGDA